jgi:hypothetical protein
MNTYQAKVRVPYGGSGWLLVDARIQAATTAQAKALLQAQYGAKNVISLPMQIQT